MFDELQEIYNHLSTNKMRTILTGISVSMGIFLLIILLGAGNGLINAFNRNQSNMVQNLVDIAPGSLGKVFKGWPLWRPITFESQELPELKERFSEKTEVAMAQISHFAFFSHQGKAIEGNIVGVQPEYAESHKIKILEGRFLNPLDLIDKRKNIVIGKKLSNFFFDGILSPINQVIKINDIGYRVVGIFDDNFMFNYVQVYCPLPTVQTIWKDGNEVSTFSLLTRDLNSENQTSSFEENLRRYLSVRHQFDPTDLNAVSISFNSRFAEANNKVFVIITNGLWILGLLTLLSGVTSVSNIMLITVRERTHEIGIRKAIGAKPISILRTILIESVVITAFFGYVGLVCGVILTEYMSHVVGQQTIQIFGNTVYTFLNPTVGLSVAIEALVVLIVSGILAGLVPAIKAVKIKPIEALNVK